MQGLGQTGAALARVGDFRLEEWLGQGSRNVAWNENARIGADWSGMGRGW